MDREGVRKAIRALDRSGLFQPPDGEMSIVFLDDEQIAGLHRTYLGDPSPTDVITFPGDPNMDFAGEICVSAERAKLVARRRSLPFSRELTLYLAHGWLHLAGFEDTSRNARRRMRRAEKKAMRELEESGRMPEFALS